MRLNRYLIERIESLNYLPPSEIANTFKKDCSKYIKLLSGKRPMFKGMESQYLEPQKYTSKIYIGRKKVRKNRRPSGTQKWAFEFVNKWLDKKGWPRRDKSLILTSNEGWSDYFGNAYYVFPINTNYGYAWVEASDFNDSSPGKVDWDVGRFHNLVDNDEDIVASDMLEEFVHGNKHFDIAYNREYETWMDCNYYYFLGIGLMKPEIQIEFREAFKKIGVKL